MDNEEWLEQELKAIRKYTTEFEENVCESHLPSIRECVEMTLFGGDDDDEVVTSDQAMKLECYAEYGIRFLIDNMLFDPQGSDDVKLFTIGSIRTKLSEVRARIDGVLDRAEKEIGVKDE